MLAQLQVSATVANYWQEQINCPYNLYITSTTLSHWNTSVSSVDREWRDLTGQSCDWGQQGGCDTHENIFQWHSTQFWKIWHRAHCSRHITLTHFCPSAWHWGNAASQSQHNLKLQGVLFSKLSHSHEPREQSFSSALSVLMDAPHMASSLYLLLNTHSKLNHG